MPARVCAKCQLEIDTEEPCCPRDGTRLLSPNVYDQIAAETDPLAGQRIADRYLVIRKLGEGGMGDVFLAEHEEIEKRLALKVLKHEYSTRPDVVARFKQEAISASRIKHPNVVDVFDFGQIEDGRFFLAMELLEGKDLADVLAEEGELSPERGLSIAMQMCRALVAAHAKGVVHRDLKPENVFLSMTAEGTEVVKLVDFGIAKLRDVTKEGPQDRRKLTKTGMIFGTPEYMAPEQAAGKNVDEKVDVYATGIVLFEMFAGRVPFTGDTFMAVLTAHATDPVPSIGDICPHARISVELEQAIYRALVKKPSERHPSMAAFAEALGATPEAQSNGSKGGVGSGLAKGSAVPSRTTLEAQLALPTEPEASGRGRWVAGAIVGLLLVGTAGFWGYRSQVFPPSVPSAPEPIPAVSVAPSVAPRLSGAPMPAASPRRVVEVERSVVIRIESKPEGALIKKREGDELFQICAATPCDYPAGPDERLELVAQKAGLQGTAAVLARTSQTIVIELRGRGVRTPRPSTAPRTSDCEFCVPKGEPDCIKIIRPCTDPPY